MEYLKTKVKKPLKQQLIQDYKKMRSEKKRSERELSNRKAPNWLELTVE